MAELLAGVCAGTVAIVLLAAFAGHLRAPRTLPSALAAHRTVPDPLVRPLAAAAVAIEGVLGAATGYALVSGRPHALRLGATGAAILLAAYAAYGLYVLRARPSVPCGCTGGTGGTGADTPMSGWVAGRAAALALAALATVAGAEPAAGSHGAHTAITLLASVVFAVTLWLLPQAMFDPTRRPA
jgi:hypothetical protein